MPVQVGEERQLPTHGQSELEGSGKGECVYRDLFKTDLRRVLSMTLQDLVPAYLSSVGYWVVHGHGRHVYVLGTGVGFGIMDIVISMRDLC